MGQVVGTSVPRIDTLEKVLGSGKFTADMHLPGLLYGKLRLSEHAHARVLAVDTSEAERLPGVRAVTGARVDIIPRSNGRAMVERQSAASSGVVRNIARLIGIRSSLLGNNRLFSLRSKGAQSG